MFKFRLVFFIFILAFVIILIQLFNLQILNPKLATNNLYYKDQKILPKRGRIYDQLGQPLVLNQIEYLLFVEPKKINDKKNLVEKLNKIIQLGEATLEAKIDFSKDWVAITRGISEEKKKQIEDQKIVGVGFEEESRRYYPEASIAAHLLGFVGKNYWGDDTGYFGIEGYFQKELAGLPGVIKSERDLLGRPIFVGTQEKIDPEDGSDIYLTIDKSVQAIAKKRLNEGLESYQAKQGCVVIANPFNLEILALVCLPDFDPNQYGKFSEEIFKNPVISDLYEPGSIFKPLIVASAIEEKKILATDEIDEKGPIKIDQYLIKTWDNKYEGKISITRVLERSSNVGMVEIGKKLGQKKIYQYLEKFGFGQLTGISLQGEVAGSLKPFNQWYPIDWATVTFGQGIAVTPIQFVRAFASVINGGQLMKPYLVKKIVFGNKEKNFSPEKQGQIFNQRTSEIVKKMLVSTVENGEVNWAKPEGYQIGGKTGTAQVPIAGHYDPNKTVASFVGFFPAQKPRFLILVILREPKTSPWGSETAAPIFFRIVKDLIVYYGIMPD